MRIFNLSFFLKYGDKLLFAAALIVLAAGLYRSRASKAAVETETAPPPSLVFTQWWEDDLGGGTLETIVKEFEQKQGGVKIVLEKMTYEDLGRNLFDPAGIPRGDVFALDPLWIPALAEKNIIENASPQLLSFITVLYYNVGLLKNSGFTRPPKTRSEFSRYARAITNRQENRWGLVMDSGASRGMYDNIYPWIWAGGTGFVKEGKPALNSPELRESIAFLASLNSEGVIAPVTASKLEDFVSGRAAFMTAPANAVLFVRERVGDGAFGVTSIPVPDNYAGKSFYGTAGWALGVNSASELKEEARLFTEFLSEKASLFAEKTGAVPGNSAPDPFYSKVWDISIAGEPAPNFSGLSQKALDDIFREELAALFAARSSPADTAAAIQKRWETETARE